MDKREPKSKSYRVRLSGFRKLKTMSDSSDNIKMISSTDRESIDQYVEEVLEKYDDKMANIILLNESLVLRNNELNQKLIDLETKKAHLRNNTSEELKVIRQF